MSRTYRRTGKEVYSFRPYKYERTPGIHYWNYVKIRLEGNEYKKEKARYHSDMGFGSYSRMSPPNWWRRKMDMKIDIHNSKEIHKFLRDEDYEPNTYNRYIGNDSWYW